MNKVKNRLITIVLAVCMVFGTSAMAFAATVSINKTSAVIAVGNTQTLQLKNVKKSGKIIWKTSNSTVATVSRKGVVKGVSEGKAKITGKYNGKSYSCKITVKSRIASVETTPIKESSGRIKAVFQTINGRAPITRVKSQITYYDEAGKPIYIGNGSGNYYDTKKNKTYAIFSVPRNINCSSYKISNEYEYDKNSYIVNTSDNVSVSFTEELFNLHDYSKLGPHLYCHITNQSTNTVNGTVLILYYRGDELVEAQCDEFNLNLNETTDIFGYYKNGTHYGISGQEMAQYDRYKYFIVTHR